MDVETFLCQSRKKISFSKINLLNLGKNLVGPWGSTQLGERSPKPVSHPKSDTRKVSHPSSPQNRPTCTCTPVPRASARTSPLAVRLYAVQPYADLGTEGNDRPFAKPMIRKFYRPILYFSPCVLGRPNLVSARLSSITPQKQRDVLRPPNHIF